MVVGTFESLVGAQRAVADLVDSGYRRNAISVLVRHAPGSLRAVGASVSEQGALAHATDSAFAMGILAGGSLGVALRADKPGSTEKTVMTTLANAGLNVTAARFFADAICNGAILVAVHCPECEVRDARDILDTYCDLIDDHALRAQSAAAARSQPS
jgi:hypothetical protein